MSLENSNKKPTPEMEESFLIDQKLQLTVEDDFSCFIKIEEIAGILDPYSIHQKKDPNNMPKPNSEADSQLIDKFEVEDDFSYFSMYDDLMGVADIPVESEEELNEQNSNTSKSPDASMNWWDRELTPNEYAQGLEILFSGLNVIKNRDNIRRYFKGEITSNELVANANEETIHYIHRQINRVLNYRCKDTRYYICLPEDMFFNTKECGASSFIIACKLDESFNDLEMSKIIGPDDFKSGTYVIKKRYLEIDGDFSQIPSGARLSTNDYLQILKSYPNIIAHLSHLLKTDYQFSQNYIDKNEDEMRQLALEHLQRWLGWYPKPNCETSKLEKKEGITVLSQETIDSITFVQPVEYVTLEEVKNGTFGTFEEISVRTNNFQGHLLQDKKTPKALKLTPQKKINNHD